MYSRVYVGAGNGDRTRDPKLGKLVLYQLSYARLRITIDYSSLFCQYKKGGVIMR
jgi:hypothetical protein